MGKKRKRTSRKERQPRLHAEQQDGANAFEIGTSNNDEISAYSARAVNCEACLHRTESPSKFIFSCSLKESSLKQAINYFSFVLTSVLELLNP